MATLLADILFWFAAIAIGAAQAMILVSTRRAQRFTAEARAPGDTRAAESGAGPSGAALETAYAVVPALALIVLLVAAWGAMHPREVRVEGVAPATGKRS